MFLLYFYFLIKSKMVTLFGDVTDLNIPHIEEKIKGFPLKAKSSQNTAPYQKLRGGGVVHQPPSPCTTVGVRLYPYVRGLK